MDKSKASSQPSSLDSLRTVEFRQTLRGYHIDDVDEYLERVAVDAEALQEQLRQAGERIKQAADRISQLERQAAAQPVQTTAPAAASATAPDESLQRTLVLAQKFVEQTHTEAEAEARSLLSEAEQKAKSLVEEADQRARSLTEDSERRLREDIARLEATRSKLAHDVETIAQHLDAERGRLRESLSKMLSWVDEHVQPSATLLAQPPASRRDDQSPSTNAPTGPTDSQPSLLGAPADTGGARTEGQDSANPMGTRPTAGATRPPEGPGGGSVTGGVDRDRAGVRR